MTETMMQHDQMDLKSTQAVPVILCGKTLEVGENVMALIRPEIERTK